jgi:hypothetical protein
MKAIIATFGDRGEINHLWLVEGQPLPDTQWVNVDFPEGFVTSIRDRRIVMTLCGEYREKGRLMRRIGKRLQIVLGWLYVQEVEVCKQCETIARQKGIGMGYYKVEGEG